MGTWYLLLYLAAARTICSGHFHLVQSPDPPGGMEILRGQVPLPPVFLQHHVYDRAEAGIGQVSLGLLKIHLHPYKGNGCNLKAYIVYAAQLSAPEKWTGFRFSTHNHLLRQPLRVRINESPFLHAGGGKSF